MGKSWDHRLEQIAPELFTRDRQTCGFGTHANPCPQLGAYKVSYMFKADRVNAADELRVFVYCLPHATFFSAKYGRCIDCGEKFPPTSGRTRCAKCHPEVKA